MTAAPSTPLDLDRVWQNAHQLMEEARNLRAELEAMKAEADDQAQTIERLSIACGEQTLEIAAATARERTLIGLVETAREALEPFAKLAGPLVDDGACTAIGLTERHFVGARDAFSRLNEATK